MGLRDGPEISKLKPGDPWLGQTIGPFPDSPLNRIILPLMHKGFLGGAIHAVLLLQKGYADERACDLAGFMEEPPS
jgi:hypothetical protein